MASSKKKNYRDFTGDDLRKELGGLVKALFDLRVKKVTDVVENPAAFRKHRREIARIKTELRTREIKKEQEAAKAKAAAPKPVPAPKPAPAAKPGPAAPAKK